MAVLPIVTYNDPVLRQKTTPVTEFNEEVVTLISDMFETMYNSDGVGLAAPQIGLTHSIFVIDADHMVEEGEEAYGPLAFINPQIVEKKGMQIPMDEGCLSIPQVNDKVIRPEIVVVKFKDQNFQDREIEFDGWAARVVQHEYDHLQGILFIDYLSAFRKRMHKSDLEEIDKGLRETEYPIKPRF